MTRRDLLFLCTALLVPGRLLAQTASWEIEAHWGRLFAAGIPDGAGSLPASGATYTTMGPLVPTSPGAFQSRRVSSWFYGDGTRLLNGAAAALNVGSGIAPLDGTMTSPIAERRNGWSVGATVARTITPRFAAQFAFDYSRTPLEVRASAASGLGVSSNSFGPAFEAVLSGRLPTDLSLLGGEPLTDLRASSSYAVHAGVESEATVTASLRVNLVTRGRFLPYVAAGGGVAWRGGDAPSATVEGGYSFTHTTWDYVYICDGVEEGCTLEPINRYSSPFDEHDVVGVRQTADSTALIGEFGGGIDLLVTSSSGFRTDFRVRVSPAVDRVVLDASPTINRSTSGSYAASFTHPSLAFNSLPSSSFPPVVPGPPSSLSGPVVDDFTTFEAEGTHLQLLISVGYFFRF